MSLIARMTRHPIPFEPDRGADAVALLGASGPLADLVAGAAGCSPYLGGLIGREAEWLRGATEDPEAATEACLAGLGAVPLADLSAHLRQAKRRIALIAALTDLAGVWPLEQVTGALTRLADGAIEAGLRLLVAGEIARGKVPGQGPQDAETSAGMVMLAMGKMGAHELNYSSDIDLICLFDETRFAPDDTADARAAFVRVTRKLTALLSDLTDEGYVFRTDLRLRPDASVTPVCLSMAAAESYYESVGRTWERAAYIKARPCAGDLAAGEGFLKTLRPFVWRKHLDFAAIEDAHDMRLRIRAHKGLAGKLRLEGHNLKLGRGGIREIEFFTQTRQLIAGGRDASLRVRGTIEGLDRLAAADWVSAQDVADLSAHYRAHREVEHRLQMIGDAQTHDLPQNAEGFSRLAAFMGQDVASLRRDLTQRIEAVNALTEGFFAPSGAAAVSEFGAETMAGWYRFPALRSERASAIFRRLRPEIARLLSEAPRPDEALATFEAFLGGLPAGVQLFSLFEANPQLTRLIVDIAATAPALAQYLSRNAGVFDAVIGGGFFAPWPETAELAAELGAVLRPVPDYEARLDAARRWHKDWHFRIGVHHLRGLTQPAEAGAQYAALAEAVVAALFPVVVAQMAVRHGPPPGRGAVVVAMGSLGAGRLNAGSDLDLIVIYDADGVEMSEGKKPLPTKPYYAKLTQAMITALTAPTAEGRLYEVDMRLRPSGRQGPVATSLEAFAAYQRTEAWTWEHLALTRARAIAGAAALCADFETTRQDLLCEKSGGMSIGADVADMRARVLAARPGAGGWDAKAGPGRLQDVELAAETLALRAGSTARDVPAQIDAGVASGRITVADGAALLAAYGLFSGMQTATRLLSGETVTPEELGEGGRRIVLRDCEIGDARALAREVEARSAAAAAVFAAMIGTVN